jgi:hypothetical protein
MMRQRASFSKVARELAEPRVLRKFHLDERRADAALKILTVIPGRANRSAQSAA